MAHLEKFVDKYHGNSQTTFTLNINLGKGLKKCICLGNYHNTEISADCTKKRMRINGTMTMMDVKNSKQVQCI